MVRCGEIHQLTAEGQLLKLPRAHRWSSKDASRDILQDIVRCQVSGSCLSLLISTLFIAPNPFTVGTPPYVTTHGREGKKALTLICRLAVFSTKIDFQRRHICNVTHVAHTRMCMAEDTHAHLSRRTNTKSGRKGTREREGEWLTLPPSRQTKHKTHPNDYDCILADAAAARFHSKLRRTVGLTR